MDKEATNKTKILKLLLFGVVIFVLAMGSWIFGEFVRLTLFKPAWKADFDNGMSLKNSNPDEAQRLILKAINEAKESKIGGRDIAKMYLQYGLFSAAEKDWGTARKYFDQAFILLDELKDYSLEADCCQSAAWAEHCEYWNNHSWKPEVDYEKKAVEAASKNGGEKSTEYYLWTLGNLYIDRGEFKEAEESFNKATAILSNTGQKTTAYDLSSLARLYAAQHQWDKSLETFLKAHELGLHEKDDVRLVDSGYLRTALAEANPDKNKYDFSEVRVLLERKDFDKLDQIAQKLRTEQEVLPNGQWRLDKFYEDLFYLQYTDSGKQWQSYLNSLLDWTVHNPDSPTAHIALAYAYMRYAWRVRGDGESFSVSPSGWQFMKERLKKAEAQLHEAEALSTKCPHMYAVWANIALGQGHKKADYDKKIEKCAKDFPTYLTLKMSKNYFLLPRWYGDSGEWEKRTKELADKVGGIDGDVLYAQMIWDLDYIEVFNNIFSDNQGLDWQRVKRGMQEIIKRYPHDTIVRAELIKLALQAKDDKTAKEAFKRSF